MANKNFYDILGVDKNASDEEIKRAYKQLVLTYHPDKQVGKTDAEKKAAEEKIKDINEAYHILSDHDKRQQYDNFGTTDGNYSFEDAFGRMNDFVRQNFWGFGTDFVRSNQMSDIQVNVAINLSDLFKKTKKSIKYDRFKKCTHCDGTGAEDKEIIVCPHCNGKGVFERTINTGFNVVHTVTECPYCHGAGKRIKKPCRHCSGSGLQRKTEEYTFYIPDGATEGAFTNIPGMGNESTDGSTGNLKLVFRVKDEGGFHIDPNSLYDLNVVKELPILDFITGADATIKHIDGKEYKFTVKQGAREGSIIRLRDCGVKMQNGKSGFLNVHLKQKMPDALSKSDIKLLNKLRDSKNFK